MKIILETLKNIISDISYWLKSNLVVFANLIQLSVPYIMYFIPGERTAKNVWPLIIPIIGILLFRLLNAVANKIGKGNVVPVPSKRFTEISEDGEVSVETARLQEMLLYLADVEDYIERKHLN